MKNYMKEAIEKLKEKEIVEGNFGKGFDYTGTVKLEDAIQALEELEVAILNSIEEDKAENQEKLEWHD